MRILVDLTRMRRGGENGGIKPALKALFTSHNDNRDEFTFLYLVAHALIDDISLWASATDVILPVESAPRDIAMRQLCDVVFCPFGNTDWACPGIPTVSLIVDVVHRDFPESLSAVERRYRESYFCEALLRADAFLVISDFTAGQLCHHYPESAGRIARVYLAVQDRLSPAMRSPSVTDPYFFYPANAWVHKNHEALLVAFAIYRKNARNRPWKLLLSGHPDERFAKLSDLARTLGVEAWVEFKGYVSDAELASLWGGAGALVFPSLHEGFGIPLLEAMAYGVPIVASNSTAIPEVVGDAGLLVETRAPLALAEAMQAISEDADLRLDLVKRGRRRATRFVNEVEVARLFAMIRSTANNSARFERVGYYAVDGLTDPIAIFGLPASTGASTLLYLTRPLGCARAVELSCGANRVAQIAVAAERPSAGELLLPDNARTLAIRTLDASRLSPTDPRTHGILLEKLQVRLPNGRLHDLLKP